MSESMDQLMTAEFKEAFDEFDKVGVGTLYFTSFQKDQIASLPINVAFFLSPM